MSEQTDRDLCPYCRTPIPDKNTPYFEMHAGGDCRKAIRREALAEAEEFMEHQSWRCRDEERYPGECHCGLDKLLGESDDWPMPAMRPRP